MMNWKIVLLYVCLAMPILSNAKPRRVVFKSYSDDRTLDASVSIEAFFDDELKELTLAFYDEGYSVLVEVKDNGGNVVYTNHLMMVDGDNVRIPLEELSAGKYLLSISDGETMLAGEFVY